MQHTTNLALGDTSNLTSAIKIGDLEAILSVDVTGPHPLASLAKNARLTDANAVGCRERSRGAGADVVADSIDRVGVKRGIFRSTCARRSTCSANVSALSVRITLATVCNRTRSSSDNCSLRRRKIPPGLSTRCASVPAAIKLRMRSCKT